MIGPEVDHAFRNCAFEKAHDTRPHRRLCHHFAAIGGAQQIGGHLRHGQPRGDRALERGVIHACRTQLVFEISVVAQLPSQCHVCGGEAHRHSAYESQERIFPLCGGVRSRTRARGQRRGSADRPLSLHLTTNGQSGRRRRPEREESSTVGNRGFAVGCAAGFVAGFTSGFASRLTVARRDVRKCLGVARCHGVAGYVGTLGAEIVISTIKCTHPQRVAYDHFVRSHTKCVYTALRHTWQGRAWPMLSRRAPTMRCQSPPAFNP